MANSWDTSMWLDISSEKWREYWFGDAVLRIEKPSKLFVTHGDNGDSHRVLTKAGYSWYIPRGWIGINWKANPPFTF